MYIVLLTVYFSSYSSLLLFNWDNYIQILLFGNISNISATRRFRDWDLNIRFAADEYANKKTIDDDNLKTGSKNKDNSQSQTHKTAKMRIQSTPC